MFYERSKYNNKCCVFKEENEPPVELYLLFTNNIYLYD